MSNDNTIIYTNIIPHGCRDCGEVNRGYKGSITGHKICSECGGIVLNLQEVFDYVMQLRAEQEHDTEW